MGRFSRTNEFQLCVKLGSSVQMASCGDLAVPLQGFASSTCRQYDEMLTNIDGTLQSSLHQRSGAEQTKLEVGAGSSRPDVGDQGTLGWEDGIMDKLRAAAA
eukprot:symbB.v1.2.005016.t1/scaffold288.1/size478366/46